MQGYVCGVRNPDDSYAICKGDYRRLSVVMNVVREVDIYDLDLCEPVTVTMHRGNVRPASIFYSLPYLKDGYAYTAEWNGYLRNNAKYDVIHKRCTLREVRMHEILIHLRNTGKYLHE